MSSYYSKGDVVIVKDPKDENFEREGPVVIDHEDQPYATVHFEDHTKKYHDYQIRSTGDVVTEEGIAKLPAVPKKYADGVPEDPNY